MTFQEFAKLDAEALAKQGSVILEEARAQSLWLRGDFKTQEEALKFVRTLSDDEYINYVKGLRQNPAHKGEETVISNKNIVNNLS